MARVYVSAVVQAPVGRVWALVRDFNGLATWTGVVAESRIELGRAADQVGCVRILRLKDGALIRERLLALSDYDMAYTYSILESPMGVESYIAILALSPITEGDATFAAWSAEFEAAPEREAQLVATIGRDVFAAGLTSLQRRFRGG